MQFGKDDLYVLCRDTRLRLSSLSKLAKEGKQLDGAIAFCRYLRNSGIIRLFKLNPQSDPLPVDGYLLECEVAELESEVLQRFKSGNVEPKVELSELERISHKLDLIAGVLSQLPVPVKIDVASPPLRVIDGGANG